MHAFVSQEDDENTTYAIATEPTQQPAETTGSKEMNSLFETTGSLN
jgi:hypothetical protein